MKQNYRPFTYYKIPTFIWSLDMESIIEPPYEKTGFLHMRKTKTQISCTVTAQLISAFVFDTQIAQSLYFLNMKFQTSSHLVWSCGTWSETPKTGFLTMRLNSQCCHSYSVVTFKLLRPSTHQIGSTQPADQW